MLSGAGYGLSRLGRHIPSFSNVGREEFRKETIDYKRNWLSIVRQAREDTGHVYDDFFLSCQSSCQWAGLENATVSHVDTNNIH